MVCQSKGKWSLLSSHARHRQPRCPLIIYAGEHPAVANGLPSSVRPQASAQQWTEAIVQDDTASPGKIPAETVSLLASRVSKQCWLASMTLATYDGATQ